MQRYELIADGSSKFWEAGTDGSVLTVRFGRIGTAGQSKDKSFGSAEAAIREFDKLVREKTGKGYQAADPAPAVHLAPSSTPVSSTAPEERPAEKEIAVDAPPLAAMIAKPESGDATASIFAATPIPSRMRPGPPLDAAADWAAFVRLVKRLLRAAPERVRDLADDLDARLAVEPASPLDAAQALDWVERLIVACPALEQRIYSDAKSVPGGREARAAFAHFARWLVAHSGIAPLLACLDLLKPHPAGPYKSMPHSLWQIPNAVGVRAALVGVADADYDAALADCLARHGRERDRNVSTYLAYILADDRPHAEHDLRVAVQLPRYIDKKPGYGHSARAIPLITDLPPSQAAPWQADTYHKADFAIWDVTAAEATATVIAVARHAGEPATASLAWLLRDAVGGDRTMVAKALLDTRSDDAMDALLPFVGSKLVRDALDAADAAFPSWTLPAYLAAMAGKGEAAYAPRVAALIGHHGADTAREWVKEAKKGRQTIVSRLDKLLAERDVPLAPREAWPAVLADPPWRRKQTTRDRPEVVVAPIATPFAHGFGPFASLDRDTYAYRSARIVKSMGMLASAIAETERSCKFGEVPPVHEPIPPKDAPPDVALAWLTRRLRTPNGSFFGFYHFNYGPWMSGVAWQPLPLALVLWDMTETLNGLYIQWEEVIATMVSRFGETAVPGLIKLVAPKPAERLPLVFEVDTPEIATIAAHALYKVKPARAAAVAWLREHPFTAAMRLLPISLGPPGSERDAADAALGFLVTAQDGRAALDAAVAAYAKVDPRVGEAAFIDRDPLSHVPSKPPKLPPWIVPAALSRPRIASGEALPDAAIAALCEMLAFSSPLAPYAGVEMVREAFTAASLDAFALDLFQAWLAAGANAASEWAMRAMGDLGGDACARDLTRQIRVWGQAGLKPRGKAGIAVLAAIGTDLALMNLSALAEKNPLLQLREAAKEAITAIAEARGLAEVELADRLSPDLGLDARGGLDLDFGPRAFRVGFDESLRPWVRDLEGRRLPSLPRATKTDDAEKAKAAGKLWAGLKKDAEATARLQITRFETMLATGRRIAPDVFWPFFAAHPLVRHLAGRLVWGIYDDALPTTRPRTVFRLAEDLAATDAEDAQVDLGSGFGLVGIVHPLHLGIEALARWTTLFGDYEIAQPFAQLARETYTPTAAEAGTARLARFAGAKVAGRRLRGLRSQGWTTDSQSEHVSSVQRRVTLADGSSLVAILGFKDGFYHSPSREGDGIQTLESLTLTADGWRASTSHSFGDLDPVTASEILRTPSLLAATGGE